MPPTAAPPITTGAPTVSGGLDPVLFARAISVPLTAALEALGSREAAEIQQSISRPVEVMLGPGGHEMVKRSAPGEPPRMDYGVLVRNISHTVEPGPAGTLPMLEITAERPPGHAAQGRWGDQSPTAAVDLEYGHGDVAPRPYMRPALVRLEGYAAEFVAEKLGQSL